MKIAVFGAAGRIGSRIITEALNRGHDVTAVVRKPETYIVIHEHLKVAKGDIFESQSIEGAVFDHDAVVSAYSPTGGAAPSTLFELVLPLTAGLKQAGVKRLLVVGGAGSLEVAPGIQVVDTPNFPAEFKAVALAHRDALKAWQKVDEIDWTYASPSAFIEPGARTGKFRTGTTQLLTDEQGNSKISMEDFAIAILDEIENPQFIKQQFTVGY
ncbi:MAG: NAD(P)-dependent oxidoreductase [Mucilaginibacter sp.]|uniref:NAD(P)-dependent oxidoreductase n=1 Tax=Mucilaginibacter sp. TaxID=1882438 RepID=UPI003264FC8F